MAPAVMLDALVRALGDVFDRAAAFWWLLDFGCFVEYWLSAFYAEPPARARARQEASDLDLISLKMIRIVATN